jgi:hypothetical protein
VDERGWAENLKENKLGTNEVQKKNLHDYLARHEKKALRPIQSALL